MSDPGELPETPVEPALPVKSARCNGLINEYRNAA
jgi:hypothetical protein